MYENQLRKLDVNSLLRRYDFENRQKLPKRELQAAIHKELVRRSEHMTSEQYFKFCRICQLESYFGRQYFS